MARIRTIKPTFFFNEELAALPAMTRLFFIGLWTQVDREGRCEDRPVRLKANLFPYEDVDVDGMILELIAYGHLVRYSVAGVKVLAVPNFTKHQIPHYKEVPSILPQIPKDFKVKSTSLQRQVKIRSTSGQPCTQEGKGREQEGNGIAPAAPRVEIQTKEPKELTAIQKVIRGFKEAKGIDSDNKDWDRKFFARYTKAANELLKAFDGDPMGAIAYTLKKGEDWKDLSDWGLEAVVKAAGREYLKIGGTEHGLERQPVESDSLSGPRSTRRYSSSGSLAGDALRAIEHAAVRPTAPGDLGSDGCNSSDDREDVP